MLPQIQNSSGWSNPQWHCIRETNERAFIWNKLKIFPFWQVIFRKCSKSSRRSSSRFQRLPMDCGSDFIHYGLTYWFIRNASRLVNFPISSGKQPLQFCSEQQASTGAGKPCDIGMIDSGSRISDRSISVVCLLTQYLRVLDLLSIHPTGIWPWCSVEFIFVCHKTPVHFHPNVLLRMPIKNTNLVQKIHPVFLVAFLRCVDSVPRLRAQSMICFPPHVNASSVSCACFCISQDACLYMSVQISSIDCHSKPTAFKRSIRCFFFTSTVLVFVVPNLRVEDLLSASMK